MEQALIIHHVEGLGQAPWMHHKLKSSQALWESCLRQPGLQEGQLLLTCLHTTLPRTTHVGRKLLRHLLVDSLSGATPSLRELLIARLTSWVERSSDYAANFAIHALGAYFHKGLTDYNTQQATRFFACSDAFLARLPKGPPITFAKSMLKPICAAFYGMAPYAIPQARSAYVTALSSLPTPTSSFLLYHALSGLLPDLTHQATCNKS